GAFPARPASGNARASCLSPRRRQGWSEIQRRRRRRDTGHASGTGAMKYQNYPMAALAALLSVLPTTGRPVLDRTGLAGRYSFTANLQNVPAGLTRADQKNAIIQSDTPAFTALQEQLGLKLEPDRASIDMIVVDRAEKTPTDD